MLWLILSWWIIKFFRFPKISSNLSESSGGQPSVNYHYDATAPCIYINEILMEKGPELRILLALSIQLENSQNKKYFYRKILFRLNYKSS